MSDTPRTNTDRELWREREGDYYADSVHITERGGLGIDCGGNVIVKPLRAWHALERELSEASRLLAEARRSIIGIARMAKWDSHQSKDPGEWRDCLIAISQEADAALAQQGGNATPPDAP